MQHSAATEAAPTIPPCWPQVLFKAERASVHRDGPLGGPQQLVFDIGGLGLGVQPRMAAAGPQGMKCTATAGSSSSHALLQNGNLSYANLSSRPSPLAHPPANPSPG